MINRNRINGPTKAVADPSYVAECQFALEPSVFGMMKLATEAGWVSSQAATAIAILAAEIAGVIKHGICTPFEGLTASKRDPLFKG